MMRGLAHARDLSLGQPGWVLGGTLTNFRRGVFNRWFRGCVA
jgi:hypothetical protein